MSDIRPQGAPLSLTVEVDYSETGRWIVVIDTPDGPFSAETDAAAKVECAARQAIAEVLRVVDVELSFVDFDGHPWSRRAMPDRDDIADDRQEG